MKLWLFPLRRPFPVSQFTKGVCTACKVGNSNGLCVASVGGFRLINTVIAVIVVIETILCFINARHTCAIVVVVVCLWQVVHALQPT